VSEYGIAGGRSPAQSKPGSTTSERGVAAAESTSLRLSGPSAHWYPKIRSSQTTSPAIAFAYGSSSSFAGLHRRPRDGSYGPDARKPYGRPGPMPGMKPCQTPASYSCSLLQREPGLRAGLVEEAELDAVRDLRRDGEVHAAVPWGGSERERRTRPELGRLLGHPRAPSASCTVYRAVDACPTPEVTGL
jgi:hypothetical protein